MKKKVFAVLCVLLIAALVFAACSGDEGGGDKTGNDLKKITGVTFEDVTVNYDGREHVIEISGTLPEGAKVTYTDNKGTEAGVYEKRLQRSNARATKRLRSTLRLR